MRRLVIEVLVASGLVLVGAGGAAAAPSSAVPPKKICKITDPRLDELSGLVATADGYLTVNDSAQLASHKRVFFLDAHCEIVNQVKYSGDGPRDTEAMALAADGKTLWIGDIGDNDRSRSTIGLWKVTVGSKAEANLYRMRYPDGAHDAEALVINGDGTPIVITKDLGTAGIYQPEAPLKQGSTDGVPMKKVGQFKLPSSTTENRLTAIGRMVVTDAAVSPDRSKVVLRTYADAFQFTVTGGDVLGAFKGTPVATPLPNEWQGESIAYSPDGKYFDTVQDMQGNSDAAEDDILRYTPAVPAVKTASVGAAGKAPSAKGASWFTNLSLDDITYLVIGVGVLGAILVGFGIFGIVRARRRSPLDPPTPDEVLPTTGPRPTDAHTELMAVGGPPRPTSYGTPQPSVYGRPGGPPPPASGPARGGVYGGAPAGARPGSAQYGQPARPAPVGSPQGGRPSAGGPPQGGRPPSGGSPQGGRPPSGGQPGRGGVYGGPPVTPGRNGQAGPPPPGRSGPGGMPPGRNGYQAGPPPGREAPPRPSEVYGSPDVPRSDGARPYGPGRDSEAQDYGRTPYGR